MRHKCARSLHQGQQKGGGDAEGRRRQKATEEEKGIKKKKDEYRYQQRFTYRSAQSLDQ